MELLQHFECIVDDVTASSFTAILYDITHGFPEEIGEFPMKSISKEDKELLQPGITFDWYIGYDTPEDEEMDAVTSLIKFRYETWTAEETTKS